MALLRSFVSNRTICPVDGGWFWVIVRKGGRLIEFSISRISRRNSESLNKSRPLNRNRLDTASIQIEGKKIYLYLHRLNHVHQHFHPMFPSLCRSRCMVQHHLWRGRLQRIAQPKNDPPPWFKLPVEQQLGGHPRRQCMPGPRCLVGCLQQQRFVVLRGVSCIVHAVLQY